MRTSVVEESQQPRHVLVFGLLVSQAPVATEAPREYAAFVVTCDLTKSKQTVQFFPAEEELSARRGQEREGRKKSIYMDKGIGTLAEPRGIISRA